MVKPKPADNAPIIGGSRDNPFVPSMYTEWKARRRAKMRRAAIVGGCLIGAVFAVCVAVTMLADTKSSPVADQQRWSVKCSNGIKGEFIGDAIKIDGCEVVQLVAH